MLDGVFSFVLLDTRHGDRAGSSFFMAARDAVGVTPLYIGWGVDGNNRLPLSLSLMNGIEAEQYPNNLGVLGRVGVDFVGDEGPARRV